MSPITDVMFRDVPIFAHFGPEVGAYCSPRRHTLSGRSHDLKIIFILIFGELIELKNNIFDVYSVWGRRHGGAV